MKGRIKMKKTSSVLSILLALLMVLNVTAFAAAGDLTLTSAKVGEADLEGATVPSGSVITLTFSNNVTDATVFENNASKIKVNDSEGAQLTGVTVGAGSEKTVITVDLGEIAEGAYTLTLGKDICAKNTELTLGSKTTVSFTVGKGNGGNEGGNEGGEGEKTLTLVSAKAGDADLSGARIPAGSEITLTFSNNVTDSTVLAGNIGKIKVKDSAGAEADCTVSPGEDKTVFTVTLGSIAKGEYTLTIGKELTAKNGSTLGTKQEIAFTVKGDGTGMGNGNNPLEVVSVTVNGKPIANETLGESGEITITFSRGMTENQAENFKQITIIDSDGKAVQGVTVSFSDFVKDDAGNSYTVLTYSGLRNGKYSLKLGKDLKANNGNTLGTDALYDFTVEGDEEPAEKTVFEKIIDFFKSVINFLRNALNKVLSLIGITL